jgi:hypothetical protein
LARAGLAGRPARRILKIGEAWSNVEAERIGGQARAARRVLNDVELARPARDRFSAGAWRGVRHGALSLLGLAVLLAAGGTSQAQQSAPAPPSPPTPVAHAVSAGLGRCAPALGDMSHDTLYTAYDAQSGWDLKAPNSHIFQSVVGLRYPKNKPQNALVALIAAPIGAGGCDGVAVEVYPVATTCAATAAFAQKGGKQLADLVGVKVVLDAKSSRLFLLPGDGSTCIVVSVKSYYAAD